MSRLDGKTSETVASFLYEESLSTEEKTSLQTLLGVPGFNENNFLNVDSVQIRKITDVQRLTVELADAELAFLSERNQLVVGRGIEGETANMVIPIGTKYLLIDDAWVTDNWPDTFLTLAVEGDIHIKIDSELVVEKLMTITGNYGRIIIWNKGPGLSPPVSFFVMSGFYGGALSQDLYDLITIDDAGQHIQIERMGEGPSLVTKNLGCTLGTYA